MNPEPYLKYKVWKDKFGWSAQVYMYLAVLNKKSRKEAIRELDKAAKEMEHYDCTPKSKCCRKASEGLVSAYFGVQRKRQAKKT